MIVYGDQIRREGGRRKIETIDDLLRQASLAPRGLDRHGLLVAALIEAGELVQGLADAAAAEAGADGIAPLPSAAMALTLVLASVVGRSWDSGFATFGPIPTSAALSALGVSGEPLAIKTPEGFAHYAVYPEAYWMAARAVSAERPGSTAAVVIGIRSIGTTLSAMVASALDAPAPVTIRPVGPPFARTLQLDSKLDAALVGNPRALHAIVDEGPGLSGSTFGAVADRLDRQGIAGSDVVFFPSHAGDLGPEASPAHRARWGVSRRLTLPFDRLTGPTARIEQRIGHWAYDLIGPALLPVKNVSGGWWRQQLLPRAPVWPPVDAQSEALKFLLTTARGTFLLRFVGLGTMGLRKLEMARALGRAGFGIEPLGWRHGFLVEPWRDDCRPVESVDQFQQDMPHRLATYLAFRVGAFPAAPDSGASLETLLSMARHNIAEGLGHVAAAGLDRWERTLHRFAPRLARIAVDGRLQLWEWLQAPDGTLLKTDALDHHAAHDLIGCQPVEWDIAGASVEWGLSPDQQADVCDQIASAKGEPIDASMLHFYRIAYLAFQLGCAQMALDRCEEAERSRLLRRLAFCKTALAAKI
ncbi:hypothetical protein LGH83_12755 [Lichenihabitans sp. PAMC28606]|uniref:hypothetical protein n=1 Tax=Lichenihabitans sp. PAMC28606 TaxID=2880932 RepID=UPI001D0AE03E|nr:hypothetical protein [Lichenihabitans sp. PAMC28606]UDL93455.1 hypothetical protein LGH83_12755 [Lichenihabitans sp. PAMC28606]